MGWTGWGEVGGTTGTACATLVADGRLYLLASGLDDRKIYVTSRGVNWNGWSEFGGIADTPLSAVVFDDACHFFAKGIDDHKIYIRSTQSIPGTKKWKESGGTTDVAVSSVVFGNKLYVFTKGEGDNKIYYRSRSLGGDWGSWKEFGGSTKAAIASVVFNNELYVFTKGADDNQIYVRSRPAGGSWNAWHAVGGSTGAALAAAVFDGDLHLFAKGLGDDHLYSLMVGSGNAWSPWYPIPPIDATTDVAVAVASFENTLHLFAKGIDDKKIYSQSMFIYPLPFDDDGARGWGRGNWDEPGGGHGPGDQAFDFDFLHPEDGNVRAARPGQVVFLENHSGTMPGYGTAIHVKHSDGSTAAYLHLRAGSTRVQATQQVEQGQILARSGNTGTSDAPHLHFGIHSSSTDDGTQIGDVGIRGPHVPVYFKDKNHVAWRPVKGDPLASNNA